MRKLAILSGVFGLTGVVLGAFGAHALAEQLAARGTAANWQIAVTYQMVHAVALLGLSLGSISSAFGSEPRWLVRAGAAWSVGIVLFSGSIYILALGGPRLLGPITPLGGLAFIAGWGCVIAHALSVGKTK